MKGEEGCPKKWNQEFTLGWAELVAEDRTIRENATMRGIMSKYRTQHSIHFTASLRQHHGGMVS